MLKEKIIQTMQHLQLDGRKFEIILSECGGSVIPSMFAYQNELVHPGEFNNEADALRKALPDITVHKL